MSKRRRLNPSNKFVMLERWFWRCPAWQALPHPARSLYIELELLYCGTNNGDISLGVRKAAELLGCSINHTTKMFSELEAKGFIRAAQRGSFNWKTGRATTWILTRYEYHGKPPTTDFMRYHAVSARPTGQTIEIPGLPQKQNAVSPRASDGLTRKDRDDGRPPPTVSPRETVSADSGVATVSPRETGIVYHSLPQTERAPRGSTQAKEEWLRAHLADGSLTVQAVASELGIPPEQVEPIAAGKITLGNQSWRKLAELVARRTK
jgi:hypothetical protein